MRDNSPDREPSGDAGRFSLWHKCECCGSTESLKRSGVNTLCAVCDRIEQWGKPGELVARRGLNENAD